MGNRHVAGAIATLQRRPAPGAAGWAGADTTGDGWNAGRKGVTGTTIERYPIDGLTQGNQAAFASDEYGIDKKTGEKKLRSSGRAERAKTSESAAGRAIAAVPTGLDPQRPVDVLLHLHGWTGRHGDPYAGWRQQKVSTRKVAQTTGKKIGETTVRDVDWDRIPQQMEASGNTQLLAILPQGVGTSNFGKFDQNAYVTEVLERLKSLVPWKEVPKQLRMVTSAHSGGGATVAKILSAATKTRNGPPIGLVSLFEAINGDGERASVERWALAQLDDLIRVVGDPKVSAAEKQAAIDAAPRLRAYYGEGSGYTGQHVKLQGAINTHLKPHRAALGVLWGQVSDLFRTVEVSGTSHEKIIRHRLGDALGALGGRPKPTNSVPSGGPPLPTPTAPAIPARPPAVPVTSPGAAAPPVPAKAIAAPPGDAAALPALMVLTAWLGKDEKALTNWLFFARHPELSGRRIRADETTLAQEWLRIRDDTVRPFLGGRRPTGVPEVAASAPATAGTGRPVASPPTTNVTHPGSSATPPPTGHPAKVAKPPSAPTERVPIPAKQQTLAAKHPEMAEEFVQLQGPVRAAFDRKGGFKHYVKIRGLYAKRLSEGTSPVPRLNELVFGFRFCGDPLDGLDPRMVAKLEAVEGEAQALSKTIRAAGGPVRFEGAFQPRATTDKENSLSDHALGLALHLNYTNNPYLGRKTSSGNAAAPILERIAAEAGLPDFWGSLRRRKGEGTQDHVTRTYGIYAAASDAVARYFQALDSGRLDAAETAKRKAEYETVKRAQAGGKGTESARDPKRGFFAHTANVNGDPMLQLIKLLTGPAGLQWGGTYGSRPKDMHHFALKVS